MGVQNVIIIVIPAMMALHAKRVLLQSVRCVLQPARHHHHHAQSLAVSVVFLAIIVIRMALATGVIILDVCAHHGKTARNIYLANTDLFVNIPVRMNARINYAAKLSADVQMGVLLPNMANNVNTRVPNCV